METLRARQAHYKIYQQLGEGLTSNVYLASRCDDMGLTEQKVALKILKSRKHVQVLKREFEKLLQVRSRYCVQVLAWESLKSGSALVLEYVPGLCLQELAAQPAGLSDDLLHEILAQVKLGLQSLHRQGVVHGDLNLKNILVSEEGVVKLIDFGFFSQGESAYLTPEFAHPKLLQGEPPCQQTDEYSLKKVARALGVAEFDERDTPRAARRRQLAHYVKIRRLKKLAQTQQLSLTAPTRDQRSIASVGLKYLSLAFMALLMCFLWPATFSDEDKFGYFQVKGQPYWLQYSLNNLPESYAPRSLKKIRVGRYRWRQRSPFGEDSGMVDLQKGKTFSLQHSL